MKILIENGTYDCHNAGDLSMLKVCIERVHELFPTSDIYTVTESAEELLNISDKTKAISFLTGRLLWLQPRNIFGPAHKLLPFNDKFIDDIELTFKRKFPLISLQIIKWRYRRDSNKIKEVDNFIGTLRSFDLVILSGGGYITDSFENHASKILETLILADKFAIPFYLFGQGIGPIFSEKLENITRIILPKAKLIALRERLKGPELLEKLGVDKENIVVTGDDAIEIARSKKNESEAHCLGLNIRFAAYMGITSDKANIIVSIAENYATETGAEIIPVPISWHKDENDLAQTSKLLKNFNNKNSENIETIEGLISQVDKCRTIITTSYHAAVFALANGRTVIALIASEYYVDKFRGLADMFGSGIQMIDLKNDNWEQAYKEALEAYWLDFNEYKDVLDDASIKQIAKSKQAYSKLSHSRT
ncbi:polysaccharide pyruvyl transferase family protein [Methylophaga sp.]|uniref:polysaccharide pyruvyl transferase family protein n=1 Tax=Methylophaga sp. TaxID=2024840 RepID=UPI003A9536EE